VRSRPIPTGVDSGNVSGLASMRRQGEQTPVESECRRTQSSSRNIRQMILGTGLRFNRPTYALGVIRKERHERRAVLRLLGGVPQPRRIGEPGTSRHHSRTPAPAVTDSSESAGRPETSLIRGSSGSPTDQDLNRSADQLCSSKGLKNRKTGCGRRALIHVTVLEYARLEWEETWQDSIRWVASS
jgi:hypothetical protein